MLSYLFAVAVGAAGVLLSPKAPRRAWRRRVAGSANRRFSPMPVLTVPEPSYRTHGRGDDDLADVMCSLLPRCLKPAEGWFDGVPCCLSCVDAVINHEAALYLNPWLKLPDLRDDPFR